MTPVGPARDDDPTDAPAPAAAGDAGGYVAASVVGEPDSSGPPPLAVRPPPAGDEVLRSLARDVPPREPDLVVPLPPKRPAPPSRRRWHTGLTVAVTVLLLALFVALVRAEGGTGGPVAAGLPGAAGAAAPENPDPAPAAPRVEAIRAEVSSVDPSGGSGFRRDDGRWRTQSYTSPSFGNLKDGVGLLLDLGTPRAVTAVRVDADGPLDLELRAGDRPAKDGEAFARVAAADGADGPTQLDGSKGGEHRYWLVWVTGLAPGDGGYRAVLGDPAVTGPAR
jgi:hypothetical protein